MKVNEKICVILKNFIKSTRQLYQYCLLSCLIKVFKDNVYFHNPPKLDHLRENMNKKPNLHWPTYREIECEKKFYLHNKYNLSVAR